MADGQDYQGQIVDVFCGLKERLSKMEYKRLIFVRQKRENKKAHGIKGEFLSEKSHSASRYNIQ